MMVIINNNSKPYKHCLLHVLLTNNPFNIQNIHELIYNIETAHITQYQKNPISKKEDLNRQLYKEDRLMPKKQ